MNMENTFLGAMIWFTGVVEAVNDPQELGRVRVRCYGYHSADKVALATEDLPWATPIMPVTSASMSGIGQSATGLEPGSWVVGFFRDGETAQDPAILGSIPTRSFADTKIDENIGFNDPYNINPRKSGDPDIPQMARSDYDQSEFYIAKKSLRQTNISLAKIPELNTIEQGNAIREDRQEWNMLNTEDETIPIYPSNHVTEYSCGHLIEFDETPFQERINTTHSSGTYEELTAGGDRTVVVKGNDYRVIFNDDNVYIKGQCNVTIDNDCRMLVKGDYNVEVEGDYNLNVHGNYRRKVEKHELAEIAQEQNTNIGENRYLKVDNDEIITILGDTTKTVAGTRTELIEGDHNMAVQGSNNQSSNDNMVLHSSKEASITSQNRMNIETQSNMSIKARSTMKLNAAPGIYLN